MLHKLLAVALVFALAGSSVAGYGYKKLTDEEKAARKAERAAMTPEQRKAKRDSCKKNGKCKGGRGRKNRSS